MFSSSGEKKVVGVGIVFDDDATGLIVESLVPGSGADACGDVLPGDEILTIDGKDVTGKKAAAIAKLVAGPVDSTLVITLRRRSFSESTSSIPEKDGEGDKLEGKCESEVRVVEIVRVEFSIDQDEFIPWTKIVDAAKTPAGTAAAAEATARGWAEGAGRILAAGQGSIMKQMKSLQTSVQTNALFENLSSKATMVRDASTCRGASTCIPCRFFCTPALCFRVFRFNICH